MSRTPGTVFAILALLALASFSFFAFARGSRSKPARVEPVGPFEILTHEIRYTTGWNEGRLRRATTEVYSINYKGRPFTFVGKAGLFTDEEAEYERMNAVITFPSPVPALVVNVGDPNNRSFYYLVREIDGKPVAQLSGESSGEVAADFLDAVPGAVPTERQLAVHRAHREGGRFLLLGSYTVLDTSTLEARSAQPSSFVSPAPNTLPITMSPDRNSFVRAGFGDQELRLAVYDFVDGNTYSLSIDRESMRYSVVEEIDAAWIDHHFEWKRAEGEHDRLQRREGFVPLPHKGRLTTDPYDWYREYRIQPVKAEAQGIIVAFLTEEMGGELLPRRQYSSSDEVRIDGRMVSVMFSDDHVGIWMERGSDTSLVETIGRRIDEELTSGRWGELFVSE